MICRPSREFWVYPRGSKPLKEGVQEGPDQVLNQLSLLGAPHQVSKAESKLISAVCFHKLILSVSTHISCLQVKVGT